MFVAMLCLQGLAWLLIAVVLDPLGKTILCYMVYHRMHFHMLHS